MTSIKRPFCPAMLSRIPSYCLDADDPHSTTALASLSYICSQPLRGSETFPFFQKIQEFRNGSWARAGWPKRHALVWTTPHAEVNIISARLCSFAREVFPCAALS